MISRLLRPIAIGVAFGVAMVMLVVFLAQEPGDAAASNEPVRIRPTALAQKTPAPDFDSMVSEILAHPLFSPSRQPPDMKTDDVAEAPKEPPKMPGRLEGVSIRPEMREALFEQDGGKPIAVKEGQDIGGWTVASIRADQVLLKSELGGEQVVKPANGIAVRPQVQAMNRKPGQKKPKPAAGAGAGNPAAAPQRPGAALTQKPPVQPNPRTGR
ncbi:MAG TPA: hypothetical protein VHT51_20340 [Micropepsaceae bacterium]|jgi:hypothetical protein|nr:hypothetical protein [Micropepsaceae bacterium]